MRAGPCSIVTLAEREAAALREREALIEEAARRLAEEAPKHGGHYRLFGSAARDEIHAASDLDVLAEFPEGAKTEAAMRAAEDICFGLKLACDVMDRRKCSGRFLASALPGSRRLG